MTYEELKKKLGATNAEMLDGFVRDILTPFEEEPITLGNAQHLIQAVTLHSPINSVANQLHTILHMIYNPYNPTTKLNSMAKFTKDITFLEIRQYIMHSINNLLNELKLGVKGNIDIFKGATYSTTNDMVLKEKPTDEEMRKAQREAEDNNHAPAAAAPQPAHATGYGHGAAAAGTIDNDPELARVLAMSAAENQLAAENEARLLEALELSRREEAENEAHRLEAQKQDLEMATRESLASVESFYHTRRDSHNHHATYDLNDRALMIHDTDIIMGRAGAFSTEALYSALARNAARTIHTQSDDVRFTALQVKELTQNIKTIASDGIQLDLDLVLALAQSLISQPEHGQHIHYAEEPAAAPAAAAAWGEARLAADHREEAPAASLVATPAAAAAPDWAAILDQQETIWNGLNNPIIECTLAQALQEYYTAHNDCMACDYRVNRAQHNILTYKAMIAGHRVALSALASLVANPADNSIPVELTEIFDKVLTYGDRTLNNLYSNFILGKDDLVKAFEALSEATPAPVAAAAAASLVATPAAAASVKPPKKIKTKEKLAQKDPHSVALDTASLVATPAAAHPQLTIEEMREKLQAEFLVAKQNVETSTLLYRATKKNAPGGPEHKAAHKDAKVKLDAYKIAEYALKDFQATHPHTHSEEASAAVAAATLAVNAVLTPVAAEADPQNYYLATEAEQPMLWHPAQPSSQTPQTLGGGGPQLNASAMRAARLQALERKSQKADGHHELDDNEPGAAAASEVVTPAAHPVPKLRPPHTFLQKPVEVAATTDDDPAPADAAPYDDHMAHLGDNAYGDSE